MERKKLFFGVMLLTLTLSLASCMKYGEDDFNDVTDVSGITLDVPTGIFAQAKAPSATSLDTVKIGSDIQTKFLLLGLSALENYSVKWVWGDGTNDSLSVKNAISASKEHKYQSGIYILSVSAKGAITGQTWSKSLVVIASNLYGQDKTFILIESKAVAGGYEYKFGLASDKVAGFIAPPYSASNIPFVTGGFCSWKLNPPPSAPNYEITEGKLYITYVIVYDNTGKACDIHYGQGANWAWAPNSAYWAMTGINSGKFVFYPYNGKIYNFDPLVVTASYIPGEDGDSINGSAPPTIRDSVLLGPTSATDSIRVFVNYARYANGSAPFLLWVEGNSWKSKILKILPNIGWGYTNISIAKILANNGRLYFRFGPNFSVPNQCGIMEQSVFYLESPDLLGLQIVSVNTRSTNRYSIQLIK